jgi:hypothetical protein
MDTLGEVVDKAYCYRPLQCSDSLRILELLPGGPDEPLTCRVLEIRKSEDVSFEALSYTWGAPIFSRIIRDVDSGSVLRITENLFDALQALRLPNATRRLWIDAVCINQKDTPEQNQQVAHMDDVYRKAMLVVVWLGKEDCGKAIGELDRIGRDSDLYGVPKVFPFPQSLRDRTALENCLRLAETCDGDAMKHFYTRPWFERVWIVQEFVLAKDLTLQVGSDSISYDRFSKATCVLDLFLKRPILTEACGEHTIGNLIIHAAEWFILAWSLVQTRERHMALNNPDRSSFTKDPNHELFIHPSTLVEHCANAKRLKCQDERDRVYGMLGFAGAKIDIKPDYDSEVDSVWRDLATKSLLAGDLTVLHYAGLSVQGPLRSLSFVANFGDGGGPDRPKLGGHGRPRFHAGLARPAQVSLAGDLPFPMIKGLAVSSVTNTLRLAARAIGQPGSQDTAEIDVPVALTSEFLLQAWKTVEALALEEGQCPYPTGLMKAFARTVVADNAVPAIREILGSERGFLVEISFILAIMATKLAADDGRLFLPDLAVAELFGQPLALGIRMFDGEEPQMYRFPHRGEPDVVVETPSGSQTYMQVDERLGEKIRRFLQAASFTLNNWALFTTESGHIGFGPKTVEKGDVVFVFNGAQTPFLLRRAGVCVSEDPDSQGTRKQLSLC